MSVRVTNTGDREADEVVQLYLHQRYGSASRPVRELKGFHRVTLAAGESRTLSFPVGPDERRYWNATVRDWVTDPSTFDVWVGGDSTATLAANSRSPRSTRRGTGLSAGRAHGCRPGPRSRPRNRAARRGGNAVVVQLVHQC